MLTTLRNIGMEQMIASRPCRERDLVITMIADRVISPGSKLSCSRGMNEETAQNTLAEELSLGDVDVHELYKAMDWLLERQNCIDHKLCTVCCVMRTAIQSQLKCCRATLLIRVRSAILCSEFANALASNESSSSAIVA